MTPIHHRMPVILTKEQQSLWLEAKNMDKGVLAKVTHPYQEHDLQLYPVTTKMNNWCFIERLAIQQLAC
jgi:putative SOS response-associated peptidase YedK